MVFFSESLRAQSHVLIPPLYQQISRQFHVPARYVFCIALQESQKQTHGRLLPWPWTLNIAGTGQFYPTRQAALKGLRQALTTTKLVDVGLMQVNVKYHGHRFKRIEDMLDPVLNLQMGAQILRENYTRFLSWDTAIGKYHSYGNKPAQQQRAKRYLQHVKRRCEEYGS